MGEYDTTTDVTGVSIYSPYYQGSPTAPPSSGSSASGYSGSFSGGGSTEQQQIFSSLSPSQQQTVIQSSTLSAEQKAAYQNIIDAQQAQTASDLTATSPISATASEGVQRLIAQQKREEQQQRAREYFSEPLISKPSATSQQSQQLFSRLETKKASPVLYGLTPLETKPAPSLISSFTPIPQQDLEKGQYGLALTGLKSYAKEHGGQVFEYQEGEFQKAKYVPAGQSVLQLQQPVTEQKEIAIKTPRQQAGLATPTTGFAGAALSFNPEEFRIQQEEKGLRPAGVSTSLQSTAFGGKFRYIGTEAIEGRKAEFGQFYTGGKEAAIKIGEGAAIGAVTLLSAGTAAAPAVAALGYVGAGFAGIKTLADIGEAPTGQKTEALNKNLKDLALYSAGGLVAGAGVGKAIGAFKTPRVTTSVSNIKIGTKTIEAETIVGAGADIKVYAGKGRTFLGAGEAKGILKEKPEFITSDFKYQVKLGEQIPQPKDTVLNKITSTIKKPFEVIGLDLSKKPIKIETTGRIAERGEVTSEGYKGVGFYKSVTETTKQRSILPDYTSTRLRGGELITKVKPEPITELVSPQEQLPFYKETTKGTQYYDVKVMKDTTKKLLKREVSPPTPKTTSLTVGLTRQKFEVTEPLLIQEKPEFALKYAKGKGKLEISLPTKEVAVTRRIYETTSTNVVGKLKEAQSYLQRNLGARYKAPEVLKEPSPYKTKGLLERTEEGTKYYLDITKATKELGQKTISKPIEPLESDLDILTRRQDEIDAGGTGQKFIQVQRQVIEQAPSKKEVPKGFSSKLIGQLRGEAREAVKQQLKTEVTKKKISYGVATVSTSKLLDTYRRQSQQPTPQVSISPFRPTLVFKPSERTQPVIISRFRPAQIQAPEVRVAVAGKFKQEGGQDVITRISQSFKQEGGQEIITRIKPEQQQRQPQDIISKTKQEQVQTPQFKTPTPIVPVPRIPIGGFPLPPSFSEAGGFGKGRAFRQPKRYTPSAFAAGLGIKGKEAKGLSRSGLSLRPIRSTSKNVQKNYLKNYGAAKVKMFGR